MTIDQSDGGCDIGLTNQGWSRVPGEDPQLGGDHQGEVRMCDQCQQMMPIHFPRRSHKRVILNVGGVSHEVMWKMLEQVDDTDLNQC